MTEILKFFQKGTLFKNRRYSGFTHCVKSIQNRSFFWSVFFIFGLNNNGPEKSLHLDIFRAVFFFNKSVDECGFVHNYQINTLRKNP